MPKPTDEDPLVELARLVSGTENFDDIIGKRPAAQPQASAPRAGNPRAAPRDASFDLESELLSDLQSSFDPAPPARAAAAPRPPARDSNFDNMRLRGGTVPPAPPMPAAAPRYAPPPGRHPAQDSDPYQGTAYAGAAGYDNYDDSGRAAGYRPAQPLAPQDEASGYAAAYSDPDDARDQEYRAYDEGDFEGAESYEDDGVYGDEPPPRSRKGLIIAAVVLGLILVGGAGAIVLRGSGSSLMGGNGTPKVIAADDGPTKVKPAVQPETDGGQQNKLIYDRANPDTGANDQLVVPNNAAADSTPATTESQGSREISRIILPGAPGDQSAPDSNTPPAPQADSTDTSETDAGPRKVRTVVVKPDGTIISSEAQPKGGFQSSGASPPVASNDSNAVTPVPLAAAPATDTPTNLTPPAAAAGDPPPATDSTSGKDSSQMAPEPKPAAPAKKQVAMAVPTTRPAPADSADGAASAGGAGGYVVQVSSQRTEDQARAAYKGLQRKFPSVLGSREANIAKADLGAKGVFYRARIGPWNSRDDAASFCESLRSAGGDCIIQKN